MTINGVTDEQAIQIQIDHGYIVEDPADPHRYMIITYTAATDAVRTFRRCTMTDNPNPESKE